MAHNRKAIRLAIKTLLNESTDAGANVFTSRQDPLWETELPAILIYTEEEPASPRALQGRQSIRTLEVKIEIKCSASSNVEDALDDLMAAVEQRIDTDPTFSGTVNGATLTNSNTHVNSDGDSDVGVGVLTYECKYVS